MKSIATIIAIKLVLPYHCLLSMFYVVHINKIQKIDYIIVVIVKINIKEALVYRKSLCFPGCVSGSVVPLG